MTQAPEKTFNSTREALLNQIEEYLARNPQMTAEGFGWAAIKEAGLVERLRAGKDITTRKLDDILRFFQTRPHN